MKLFITPALDDLQDGLALLATCGIETVGTADEADITVSVSAQEKGLTVSYDGGKTACIAYSRRVEFFRGVSYLLAGKAVEVTEQAKFDSNGFMLDCSRNAAPTLDTIKATLVRMALMGLNSMQLYTEDMYFLEDRPYFGYMRGRYTDEELKAVDDTAWALGIEVVPCIQTLAHLATVLRWSAFSHLIDCNDIMMAGEDSTYAFVTEMIAKMRKCFRSRRINIGMDEAHMIGLGNYMKKHGVRPRVDIMCEHIARVLEICKDYDFAPMMWSDMFFHLAGGSYDAETTIDKAIIDKVPAGVSLVYWEYYSDDNTRYDTVLKQHKQFKNDIVFAGCAWKWNGLLPELKFSLKASRAALSECMNNGIVHAFATAWGDDGAECPLNVVLPVLQLYAEMDYHGGDVSDEVLAERFAACTGGDLADFLLLDKPNRTTENQPAIGLNPSKYLLYQDVMQGLFDCHVDKETFPAFFAAVSAELKAAGERNKAYQYLFEYEASLCDLLAVKSTIGIDLRAAYLKGDRAELARLVKEDLPEVAARLQAFNDLFYDGWMKENKPFGFDTIDLRLGGLARRIRTAEKRIHAYLDGAVDKLEEFDEPRLSFDNRADDAADVNTFCNTWTRIATASLI